MSAFDEAASLFGPPDSNSSDLFGAIASTEPTSGLTGTGDDDVGQFFDNLPQEQQQQQQQHATVTEKPASASSGVAWDAANVYGAQQQQQHVDVSSWSGGSAPQQQQQQQAAYGAPAYNGPFTLRHPYSLSYV
jgi:hypothetical protein